MPIVETTDESKGPRCERCGTPMVLIERQPHPRIVKQEDRRYICPACKHMEVVSSPTG